METTTAFLIVLGITLASVKLLDEYLSRKHIPMVLGELFLGVLLAAIFGVISEDLLEACGSEIYDVFSLLGIMFLMFISGLETDVGYLQRSLKYGLSVALLGSVVPFALVLGVFSVMGFDHDLALIYATIAVATSVGLTVRVLTDLNVLRKDYSVIIISAAVIDDIIGIVVLGIVLGSRNLYLLGVGIATFFVVVFAFYKWIIAPLSRSIEKHIQAEYTYVSLAIVFVIVFSILAKSLGLAAITGAYFAGLILGRTKERQIILNAIKGIAYAMFIPLFFVGVGFEIILEIRTLGTYTSNAFSSIVFTWVPYVFVLLAIVGKVIGAFIGAKVLGQPIKSSMIVGIGMVPRMEVALVVASIAISSDIVTMVEGTVMLYSTILLVIVSSILTPPILQSLIIGKIRKKSARRAMIS
ncbi:MAG TPA: cation:proton antiporter [Thermoprotei archaeon]|nr:cation:proton antiporter [Thermoprotei archaeon]